MYFCSPKLQITIYLFFDFLQKIISPVVILEKKLSEYFFYIFFKKSLHSKK